MFAAIHDGGNCRGLTMKRVLVAFGLLLASASSALAQTWPTKPVRVVNTFAPGGTADVLARMVADLLTNAFKQQFFVETRAGATGLIGLKSVLATEPDGYNLVLTTQSLLVTIPLMNPTVGYDPVRDLTNIAYIGGSPIVFLVRPDSGIKTFADFMAFAKKTDKPLTYSSSGFGGNGHLMTEFFGQRTGVKVEHVPYKGASQGLMDLIGGHIVFSAQTVSSAATYTRAGTLTGIVSTADERLPDYPDLPTFKELGYPELVATTWFSISAPAKLPRDIAEKINHVVATGVTTPEVRARMQRDGLVTQAMDMAEFGKFIDFETARWKPVIEKAGLVGAKAK
jgi:tripartite-type tricarboxylate transporter receptor subunit TctC